MSVTITRNGMKITCYGKFTADENVTVEGDDANGDEISSIYCNDHECTTWTEVVEALSKWASDRGAVIYELGIA